MKKITLLCALAASLGGHAQHLHEANELLDPLHQGVCGNNVEMEAAFAKDPSLRIQHELDQQQFEREYQDFLQNYDPHARAAYTVPVVVHIVHEGGPENITDEQVYDAIFRLNEDFSMTNNDLSNTVSAFIGITGNTDVEFKLATKAPNGDCHKGITRTFLGGGGAHDTGDNGFIRDAVDNAHGVWPQNRYMNVFVVKSIAGSAAYTNTPGNWYSATGNGGSIYMRHTVMGSMGTSNMSNRHILSHEVGHWLNLRHCWGPNNSAGDPGSCSTDDNVSDTPNTIGWLGICDYDGETCGTLDNVQNIMDYAGSCRTMFTQGQSARMVAALNSNTADRNNLWTASNLAATGTDGPGALCEAKFSADIRTICAGQSVTFTDESYHNVTTRSWTFTGGSPASSSAVEPVVTYNTPGVYSVTLDVGDGSSTETTTETEYIVVLDDPGVGIPYSEGFETISAIPDNENWMEIDYSGVDPWTLTTSTGYASSSCARLGNFGNSDMSIDELLSGTIDLSGVSPGDNIHFSFRYAYRKRSSENDEWLRFYISKDCGQTWVLRKNIHGDGLSTVVNGAPYTPQNDGEWYYVEVDNINSDYYVSNFRYKFQFENDNGNNIYIDNINMYPTSMSDVTENEESYLNVYPNPANDQATIEIIGSTGVDYNISVHSTLGQQVKTVFNGQLNAGLNKFELDIADLAKGVYLVRIESDGRLQTMKLVKE